MLTQEQNTETMDMFAVSSLETMLADKYVAILRRNIDAAHVQDYYDLYMLVSSITMKSVRIFCARPLRRLLKRTAPLARWLIGRIPCGISGKNPNYIPYGEATQQNIKRLPKCHFIKFWTQ